MGIKDPVVLWFTDIKLSNNIRIINTLFNWGCMIVLMAAI